MDDFICEKCGTNLTELREGERKTIRDLRQDLEEARREVQALRKQLAKSDRRDLSDHGYIRPLLSKLTDTFLILEEAGDPRRGTERRGQMRYRRADSTADEGASTRWARHLINEGIRDIRRWINKVDAIIEDQYTPPPKPPKGRCRRRSCDAYDVWQTGKVGIPFTHCGTCAHPFAESEMRNQPAMEGANAQ